MAFSSLYHSREGHVTGSCVRLGQRVRGEQPGASLRLQWTMQNHSGSEGFIFPFRMWALFGCELPEIPWEIYKIEANGFLEYRVCSTHTGGPHHRDTWSLWPALALPPKGTQWFVLPGGTVCCDKDLVPLAASSKLPWHQPPLQWGVREVVLHVLRGQQLKDSSLKADSHWVK